MKLPAIIISVILFSCDSNSSPEGRMTNKIEDIRQEFDSLKMQNAMILDSLGKISKQVEQLKKESGAK